MERPVEVGLKKSRDLGGGEWLVWGQGPDPCLPAPPQERWCPREMEIAVGRGK